MDDEAKRLLFGAVLAVPATAEAFLVERRGHEAEVELLGILRLLFFLTAANKGTDDTFYTYASQANAAAVSSVVSFLKQTPEPVLDMGMGRFVEGDGQKGFVPNDAVYHGRRVFDLLGGEVEDVNPMFPERFEALAWFEKSSQLTEQDQQREVAWEALGDGKSPWTFWVQWRRDFLAGKPPPNGVLKFVGERATPADWASGPDRIGRLIAQELRRLAEEALNGAEEASLRAIPEHQRIGSNFPPPDQRLDAETDFHDAVAGAVAPLHELRFVVGRLPEEKSRANRALAALRAWSVNFTEWCSRHFAKGAGAALAAAIGANIAKLLDTFELFIGSVF